MRAWLRSCLGAVLAAGVASSASAQPSITSPAIGQVFKAGPDYATDVLQDPWDFSNHADISPNPDEFGGWATSPANLWNANGTGPTFINTGCMGQQIMSLLNRAVIGEEWHLKS